MPVLPDEVGVALLTEAVPFHQDVGVVTGPSTTNDASIERSMVDAALLKQLRGHFARVRMDPIRPRLHREGDSTVLPTLMIPAEHMPPGSLDMICFAPHVFPMLLRHHPYYFTACHRALRPHGILAVTGLRRLRIVAPTWCMEDFNDFMSQCESDASSSGGAEPLGAQSIEELHADIYFPFPHVKRRMFTTQYHITADELCGYIRGTSEYRASAARKAPRQDDTPGVVRDCSASPADPLQVLHGLIEARLGSEKVLAEVDAFVITCDSRRTNLPSIEHRQVHGSIGC